MIDSGRVQNSGQRRLRYSTRSSRSFFRSPNVVGAATYSANPCLFVFVACSTMEGINVHGLWPLKRKIEKSTRPTALVSKPDPPRDDFRTGLHHQGSSLTIAALGRRKKNGPAGPSSIINNRLTAQSLRLSGASPQSPDPLGRCQATPRWQAPVLVPSPDSCCAG